MPPKKHGTTWKAAPHTLSKIAIQRKYLDAWFALIGTTGLFRAKPMLYIEGFAGSGEYDGGKSGSAATAVESALTALERNSARWCAGNIILEFVEQDSDRVAQLASNLSRIGSHPRLHVSVRQGSFDSELESIRDKHRRSFVDDFPLFTFLDPFGVKGIPFATVQSLLGGNHSELLLFLNAQSIARNWRARNSALLSRLFGDDDWQSLKVDSLRHIELCRLAANLYRERLTELGVRYTIPFAMYGKGHTLDYYLLFASRHPTGFDKMASAMRTISTDGQFRFSDATHKNLPLDFGPGEAAEQLQTLLRGRNGVTLDEISELFRVKTLFPTITSVLKHLQGVGAISVNWKDPKSPGRKGTFSKERVESIDFR